MRPKRPGRTRPVPFGDREIGEFPNLVRREKVGWRGSVSVSHWRREPVANLNIASEDVSQDGDREPELVQFVAIRERDGAPRCIDNDVQNVGDLVQRDPRA
jgi:hypothetical protein